LLFLGMGIHKGGIVSEAKSANTIFINCGNWDCFNVNAFVQRIE